MKTMHISLGIALLGTVLVSGCSQYDNNRTDFDSNRVNLNNFSELSRAAFAQAEESEPLRLNGRTIKNDVTSANFYDDLLSDGALYSR
jgi:hypothetical protein